MLAGILLRDGDYMKCLDASDRPVRGPAPAGLYVIFSRVSNYESNREYATPA